MKNFYDKLLLLIALLALLAGAALYVMKTGEAPAGVESVAVQPADHPYEPVPVPETPSTDASWPAPQPQSSTWVYDVFTPPKIFIDEQGQFSAEGWAPPPPPKPFGIYLASITRELYRIQMQGYIEEDRSDPSKSLLLLFDEERNAPVRLRPGQSSDAAEVEVLDFEIDRQIDAEKGEVEVTAAATILDQRTGEKVTLTDGETLYESGVTVTLRSEEFPSFNVELTEAGETFKTPEAEYELLEINLEANSAKVEKKASPEDDEAEPITRTLNARSKNTTAAPAKPAPPPPPATEATQNSDFPF